MFQNFKPEIKTLVIVSLIAIVLSVGGILLLHGLTPTPVPSAVQPSPSLSEREIEESKESAAVCEYGILPKDSYLRTYTVKEGDTLLGIASRELGSTARVNEVVELNKDQYSGLSLQNPFIEVGWIFDLPPKFVVSQEPLHEIVGYKGMINSEDKDSLFVSFNPANDSVVRVFKKDYTRYLVKENFSIGECVQVLRDRAHNALALTPQGKDYFVLLQWNEYKSTLYEYMIRYPLDWESVSYGEDSSDISIPDGGYHENHLREVGRVQKEREFLIKIWDTSKTAMTIEFMEALSIGISWDNKNVEGVTVDGRRATKVSGTPPQRASRPAGEPLGRETMVLISFSKNNHVYLIQYEGVDLGEFEEILSTFRFVP